MCRVRPPNCYLTGRKSRPKMLDAIARRCYYSPCVEVWCRGLTRCPVKAETAGSNPVTSASSIRSVDTVSPSVFVFPTYFPVPCADLPAVAPPSLPRRDVVRPPRKVRLRQHSPKIHPSLWPGIAERARYESLRDLAVEFDVSHETIRAIVRRVREVPEVVAAD
jgi:hypothetical protein